MSTEVMTVVTPSIAMQQDQPDMVMTAKASAWLDALRAVGIAIGPRPPVPVLSYVLVKVVPASEGVTLTGTDYVTRVTTQVASAVGTVQGFEGAALLPYSWLIRTIRTLTKTDTNADVTVSTMDLMGERMATVQAAGYTIPLICARVADFPGEAQHAVLGTFTTNLDNFRTALDRVHHAASLDDTLPILTSIHLEGSPDGIHAVATDRYRLAFDLITLDEGETTPNFHFNLRSQVWGKLSRILRGETVGVSVLSAGERHGFGSGMELLEIRTKGLTVQITGTDGEYPKVRALAQYTAGATVVVSRAELLRQARIAMDLGVRNCPAEVRISAAGLSVTPGVDGIKAETKAPLIPAMFWAHNAAVVDVLTAFNPNYLLEAVKAFAGVEDLKITLAALSDGVATAKPVTITAADKKHDDETTLRTVVMPVRMPNMAV